MPLAVLALARDVLNFALLRETPPLLLLLVTYDAVQLENAAVTADVGLVHQRRVLEGGLAVHLRPRCLRRRRQLWRRRRADRVRVAV